VRVYQREGTAVGSADLAGTPGAYVVYVSPIPPFMDVVTYRQQTAFALKAVAEDIVAEANDIWSRRN
jgi:hypothetical protein